MSSSAALETLNLNLTLNLTLNLNCDICCDTFSSRDCYSCDATADCITVCATCFLTWGKPMCMKCNQSISRGTLVKWLSYKTYMKSISPYWADIHVNHEKTLIPVVQRYLDWCDYIVYKKRFARWGSQMVQRGFVSKPELDNLDLDHFSSEELAQKMSGAEYYECTKSNCSGLVIFSKCGGCKSTYCSKCHEIINESDHQCDPTILQSMQEVLESTKPCPACRTLITKDGGCNDMRCSNCGVRFSWDKGTIVKKNSNPLRDDSVFGKSKGTDKDSYLPSVVAGTDEESLDYILYKRDASAVVKYATEIYNEAKLTSKMNIDALKLRIKFIKGEIDETCKQGCSNLCSWTSRLGRFRHSTTT